MKKWFKRRDRLDEVEEEILYLNDFLTYLNLSSTDQRSSRHDVQFYLMQNSTVIDEVKKKLLYLSREKEFLMIKSR